MARQVVPSPHLFVHSFVHLVDRSFVGPFVRSLANSCVRSFLPCSLPPFHQGEPATLVHPIAFRDAGGGANV